MHRFKHIQADERSLDKQMYCTVVSDSFLWPFDAFRFHPHHTLNLGDEQPAMVQSSCALTISG